jgi:hypothetical protein
MFLLPSLTYWMLDSHHHHLLSHERAQPDPGRSVRMAVFIVVGAYWAPPDWCD